MSMQATLQLVDGVTGGPKLDERRRTVRHPAFGTATALQNCCSHDGDSNRICTLELLNLSDGGLGAVACDPIDLNSNISVIFSPHGSESGAQLHGRVVRCATTQRGHEIGVRFHARPAA